MNDLQFSGPPGRPARRGRGVDRVCVCGTEFRGESELCVPCRRSQPRFCECGGRLSDHHLKCHACRTRRDRVCCDCGKEFTGSRENCTTCYELTIIRERECMDCGIAFVGKKRRCEVCQAAYLNTWYESVKDEKEVKRRIEKYGVAPGWYENRVSELGGLCSACGRKSDRVLGIDHDHSCCSGVGSCGKCVRDLLCIKCNTALGMCGDSVDILMSLVSYLLRFQDVSALASAED